MLQHNFIAAACGQVGSGAELPLARLELLIMHEFSITLAQLRASTRGFAEVAKARQTAVYLAHVVLGCSLSALARHFKRDRTTIAHACRVIEDARDNAVFDRYLDELETKLTNLASLPARKAH